MGPGQKRGTVKVVGAGPGRMVSPKQENSEALGRKFLLEREGRASVRKANRVTPFEGGDWEKCSSTPYLNVEKDFLRRME